MKSRLIPNVFLFFLSTCVCSTTYSQTIINQIPDTLKENANEIILNDETTYTITNTKNSYLTRKYKVLIMNSYTSDKNEVILYYSDFRSISNASVKVVSKDGNELQKYSLKDFGDYSTKGYSVASDSRAKYLKVQESTYPHIIEVQYTIKYVGSMFYPVWQPQSDEKQSLLHASLTINNHLNQPVRYKAVNLHSIDSMQQGSMYTYTFTVDSLKAFKFEPFSYSIEEYAPVVYSGPTDFEMDNYAGNMATWNEFGKWILQLNQNRNTLTSEDMAPVLATTKNLLSTEDKVRAVYEYLQTNTRYVSIQLGIGGWQPFESKFVHDHKYGDCKALSFYTKSLLEGIGIPSYYTLIRAGKYEKEIDRNFPNAHFNHAILTVPLEADTIWLECTSQTNPFGYLGMFTSDRNALMITPEGGKIIRTRGYTRDENIQHTLANVEIKEDGSAIVSLARKYEGIEIENKNFDYYCSKPQSDQEKWFIDNHSWGSLKLNEIEVIKPTKTAVPTAMLKVDLEMHKGAISSGKRLFYEPFVFTNMNDLRLSDDSRKVPIEIRYPFTQQDSIQVTFPTTYHPERALEDIEITTKFGSYERQITKDKKSYLMLRKFKLEKGVYPAQDYQEFRDFVKKVQKYDRQKLVMINKT